MKLEIEPTTKLVEMGVSVRGQTVYVPARIWEGTTDKGTPVFCFITRISPTVPETDLTQEVLEEFGRSLQEQKAPSVAVSSIPMRFIL